MKCQIHLSLFCSDPFNIENLGTYVIIKKQVKDIDYIVSLCKKYYEQYLEQPFSPSYLFKMGTNNIRISIDISKLNFFYKCLYKLNKEHLIFLLKENIKDIYKEYKSF